MNLEIITCVNNNNNKEKKKCLHTRQKLVINMQMEMRSV